MSTYKLEDVFGISRGIPLTYTTRSHVDDKLKDSLQKKQHVVIYGSSKQGKTCLRKYTLPIDKYITVHCSNRLDIRELNQQILKSAGFEVTISQNKTVSGVAKAKASFGFNFFAKIAAEGQLEGSVQNQVNKESLELDLEDTNDIIRALNSINFDKLIVLDDFHYLNPKAQKDFAFALKVFYENSSYCFIIVGVWLEKNRLIALNGDLAGRVIPIDAEEWTDENLREVIRKGQELLNIEFSKELIDDIIQVCCSSVYLLQEICYRICLIFKIEKTLSDQYYIDSSFTTSEEGFNIPSRQLNLNEIVKEIINQHSGRYKSFIMQFSSGLQNSEIETYKWLLYPILCVDSHELENGISFNRIKELISCSHSLGKNLNANALSSALKDLTSLQVEKNITPNILDYDHTNLILNIVDKEFIIWLSYQSKSDLYNLSGLEIDCP